MPDNRAPSAERIADILEHILNYCDQISCTHADFAHSRQKYDASYTYRNAISMCILQIGELVKHLPQSFTDAHPEIPWRAIRNTRNFVAHDYGSVDFDIVWDASTNGIGELREFCERYLEGCE